jgi:hypothetical protein
MNPLTYCAFGGFNGGFLAALRVYRRFAGSE